MKLNADIRCHLNYAACRTNPVPCSIAFLVFIDTWLMPSPPICPKSFQKSQPQPDLG